jgi:hypothetical protein
MSWCFDLLTLWERSLCVHWTGGWVGPRAGPQRGAISCLCWESNLVISNCWLFNVVTNVGGSSTSSCAADGWILFFLSLFIHLSIYLSVYPSVYILICLSVCLSIYLVRPSVHLSAFLSSLYISPSVHTSNLCFYLYVPASVRPLYVRPPCICRSLLHLVVRLSVRSPIHRLFALLSSFFLVVATLVPFV